MLNFCDFIQVYVFTTNHHLNFQMKSPCYLVTLSLESSDFQTFLKQYVILVPFGALICKACTRKFGHFFSVIVAYPQNV